MANQDPATALYGRSPAPAPSAAPSIDPELAETAAKLYGQQDNAVSIEIKVPVGIQQQRAADPAAAMYGESNFEDILSDDEIGGSPDFSKALRAMVNDMGMERDDVIRYKDILATLDEAPDMETRAAWHDQAVQMLNQEYGQGAKGALRNALLFMQQDPLRQHAVNVKNMGDHPEIIMMMARLAAKAKAAGKL